jgi:tRNA A-37 threonylcarbamoyl transferase component Bud32
MLLSLLVGEILMLTVYLGGSLVKLKPSDFLGKGGEAEVYSYNKRAVKIYKSPKHPDYVGNVHEQKAAQERITTHQTKLVDFPRLTGGRVIAPMELVYDEKDHSKVVGYSMQLLSGAEVLMRYADRGYRQAGISNNQMLNILLDLHDSVLLVHKAGIVIGDFNDLNVMVKGEEAYLVDADSFQYKGSAGPIYYCQTFTSKFVDPLICDKTGSSLTQVSPHTDLTDWYAYLVMMMNCFLFVDPYGGVYKPKDLARKVNHDARPLHRITVFNPDVRYPKSAIPFDVLSDELLQVFHQAFEKDIRGEVPRALLENIRWTTCSGCGMEHARNVCPTCATTSPLAVKQVVQVRGSVKATREFKTDGYLLYACSDADKLRYLYYEGGSFRREGNLWNSPGSINHMMRFRVHGDQTLLAQGNRLFILEGGKQPEQKVVDTYNNIPQYDCNEKHIYWLRNGQLLRNTALGEFYIGDVLQSRTRFWVGPKFGFGFYQAGAIDVAFLFDAMSAGINDMVKLPRVTGQLVDSTCVFSKTHCWFFLSTQDAGKTVNQCFCIRADGTVLGSASAVAGDGSWLGTIQGKCAVDSFLLAPTDDGVVRIDVAGSTLSVTKEFPDTEPFVDSSHYLFPGRNGLYAVGRKEIVALEIK